MNLTGFRSFPLVNTSMFGIRNVNMTGYRYNQFMGDNGRTDHENAAVFVRRNCPWPHVTPPRRIRQEGGGGGYLELIQETKGIDELSETIVHCWWFSICLLPFHSHWHSHVHRGSTYLLSHHSDTLTDVGHLPDFCHLSLSACTHYIMTCVDPLNLTYLSTKSNLR